MRVVQVSFHADPLRRDPDALLDAWPTLPAVARAASRAGAETTVVQASSVDARRERDGVRFEFVREPSPTRVHRRLGLWATPGGARTAQRALDERADVIHVHSLGFPRQLARLTRRAGRRPVLVQDHLDRVPRSWGAGLWRRALEPSAGIVFTAREQAEPFVRVGALPSTTRLFEALESSSTFVPGNRAQSRRRLGMHGEPCCVWLGRLDANKDPLTTLRAFEQLCRERPGARLWMFWRSGDLEATLRERVCRSHLLRDRVHLVGTLSHADVEHALRAADLLVQASHREASSFVVLEALACGTPPVVTDIPTLRRMTRGGAVGALFPPGDADALADALLRIADARGPAQRRAARDHFERHLDFAAVGRDLADAYAQVTQ